MTDHLSGKWLLCNNFIKMGSYVCLIRSCLLLAFVLLGTLEPCESTPVFDDRLPNDDLVELADINLGALVRIFWPENGRVCGQRVARIGIQVATAIKYTVDQINKDQKILPGIKLGTALLNDCDRPSVALARAARFAPLTQCYREVCGGDSSYKVAGVMGPYSSPMAGPVAGFLGLFNIPVMSWSASSPEFSKGDAYRYFARTVPSDEHIIEAMVQILASFNWTYFSVLYAAGARNSVYMFKQKLHLQRTDAQIKLCIALEKQLTNDDTADDFDALLIKLKQQPARVIIVFLNGKITTNLLLALERNGSAADFIFIATEGFQPKLAHQVKALLPLQAFIFHGRHDDADFEAYYRKLSPFRSPAKGPWAGEYTHSDLDCNNVDCASLRTMDDIEGFEMYNGIGRVTSIVRTYAYALHRLIQNNCPEAANDKQMLWDCVHNPVLFSYMTNVSFISNDKLVHFDKKGDIFGVYVATFTWGNDPVFEARLRTLTPAQRRKVSIRKQASVRNYNSADAIAWDRKNKTLHIDWDLLPWKTLSAVPDSVCSRPCPRGMRTVITEPDCCWLCEPCRVNEVVYGSTCTACPPNWWPSADATNCTRIAATDMFSGALGLACTLCACALLGLVKVVVILALFVRHWERKVVKGCTRELMVPIKVGLTMAYLTVFTFVYPPNDVICYFSYVGFNMSLCLLFGPLFLKTKRVHMIFKASDKYKKRVRNADSRSMVIGILVVIAVQGILMLVTLLVAANTDGSAIREVPHMAMWNVKESESRCHLESWVLLVPLSYNILLLLLCAIYGFLTRKLPDNYNESWYIFIAVTTTIFVWIACVPTYFVVKEAKYQVSLLSLALIINAIVISVCLFIPKIYAVYTIPERDIRVSRLGSRRLSMGVDGNCSPPSSNQSFHRSKSTHSMRQST